MNKKKYISLELAKAIHEMAKEKGIELIESEAFWIKDFDGISGWRIIRVGDMCGSLDDHYEFEKDTINDIYSDFEHYPAYDTYELGEMLPRKINDLALIVGIEKNGYWCDYRGDWGEELKETMEDSEPEARGKLFLYLLENNLLCKTK